MVLLAKSKKFHNYCVACGDVKTKELVRLVTDDASIHHAVKPQDLMYEDNREAEIGDIIDVTVIGALPEKHQPENILMDTQYYLEECKGIPRINLLDYVTDDDFVFFNTDKKICESELERIREVHSLQLIRPHMAEVTVKYWPNGPAVTMSFTYKGNRYKYLKVTDESFCNRMLDEADGFDRNFQIGNILLLISLGEVYINDNCRYKLIASVIEI